MSEEMIEEVAEALWSHMKLIGCSKGYHEGASDTLSSADRETQEEVRGYARAALSAYNPNERLREAAKELLSRVDSFAREIAEPAFFSERETLRAALEAVK